MKKSSIIKISAAAVLIFIIIFVVGTLRYSHTSAPKFNFLNGQNSFIRIEELRSRIKETRFIYSLEADFNDIVADANSELTALGYLNNSTLMMSPPQILYYLSGKKPGDSITIRILDKHKMNVYVTPKGSDYTTPTRYEYSWENGWISIEVTKSKQMNRFMYKFIYLINKLRGAENLNNVSAPRTQTNYGVETNSIKDAINIAISALRKEPLVKVTDYTITSAQQIPVNKKWIWRVTFKPKDLLPDDPSKGPLTLGGEVFVNVDLAAKETVITYGE